MWYAIHTIYARWCQEDQEGEGYGMVACLQLLLHVIVSVQAGGK